MTLFKNWNIWRIMRLLIGILVIYEAGSNDSFILYMIGAFLVLQAIMNPSCMTGKCNDGACENDIDSSK